MDQKAREEAAAVARINKTPPPEDEECSDDHAVPTHEDGGFLVGDANDWADQRPEDMDLDPNIDQLDLRALLSPQVSSDAEGSIFQPPIEELDSVYNSEDNSLTFSITKQTCQLPSTPRPTNDTTSTTSTLSNKRSRPVTSKGKEKAGATEFRDIGRPEGPKKPPTEKERCGIQIAKLRRQIAANQKPGTAVGAAAGDGGSNQSVDTQHAAWMDMNFAAPPYTPVTLTSRTDPQPLWALSDEEIEGLSDSAVMTPRPKAHTPATSTSHGVHMNAAVIEGDKVVTGPAKKGRAPRTQVDAEISHALLAVPEWAHASLVSVVVPCLIKFYGARNNPWDVDGKSKTDFKNLLDALLHHVHPERQHDISCSDKIWRYTCQALSTWKAGFAKAVDRMVRAATKGAAPAEITHWVFSALAKGGEVIHSVPNVLDHTQARGAMQSKYVVELLTYHLEAAEGAIIETGPPVSALALASVATGTFVANKDKFCENIYGLDTVRAQNGSVAGVLKHGHCLNTLIAVAMSELPSYKEAETQQAQQLEDDGDAYDAVDPSSSPAHDLF
ncbi:hypothetical protein K466DRAFT_568226 [Polyporus arcularius HHB13444]|uniref:Uncharacterized protein n=1 Tax=Polyporus arcularius HHB13444 TaxID=1314778 RepID=A0A5C3P1P5_9APHY|nr:hypothetical protein K466DRAFT_568226 [Polyporus arcularius HHB13444]